MYLFTVEAFIVVTIVVATVVATVVLLIVVCYKTKMHL